jgi:hypothetical protein
MHYFHNRGYYTVTDDDFDGAMRLGAYAPAPGVLPPYVEIAKLENMVSLDPRELVARSVELAKVQVARRPRRNPITVHRERILRDFEWLKTEPLSTFHQYAFATIRQAGAGFGLTASYIRWLAEHGQRGLDQAADAFETISTTAKTVQFKLARMANLKREVDVTPLLATMEQAWDDGMSRLVDAYGD